MRDRSRWTNVVKVRLIERLEDLGRDECHEHPSVGAETFAKQVGDQRDHQKRRELQTTELGDALKQWVQRLAPGAGHRLQHLLVEGRKQPRSHGDRQHDEGGAQGRDGYESGY